MLTRSMRALVVEDSASMRRLLSDLLTERAYEVHAVATGEEALEAQRVRPFDVMVVDWTLPGLSGLDVTRAVREEGGDDVVILVITGRNRPEDLAEVLEAGASDYLAKPIDPDILRTRLMVAGKQATAARARRDGVKALLAAEEAFARLVESAPDAIVVTRERQIVYVNPRMEHYLRTAVERLVGQSEESIFHPDDLPVLEREREVYLSKMEPAPPVEVRMRRRTATFISVESVAIPLEFDGHSSVLRMVRDLSDRKALQAQLLLADRMASVGTLAAGVAHELNNPLAYVLTNVRLSREELDRPLDDERVALLRTQLDEATQGARRMRDIVRDLKTFSRGESDATDVVDVVAVLSAAIHLCWNELRHRTRLERDFHPTVKVEINESRLGQVFLNLLINAAHAMEESTSATNCIDIVCRTNDEGWAEVSVSDTGSGIAPEHMGRIFDPFFTTKSISEGAGLGLAICRNIITQAGGMVGVESTPGQGSKFTLRLPPARKPTPALTPPPPGQRGAQERARVLAIDDEPLVGRSIQRALRDHDVEVVSSGADAIARLRRADAHELDVVFCDLMMPGVSGMEVYETVQRERPDIAELFVFMTGGAFTLRARRFLDAMSQELLEKPFDLTRMRALVAERVAERRRL